MGYAAPFTASLRPEGSSLSLFDLANPEGTWTLRIVDNAGADVGTLNSWTLKFITKEEPQFFSPVWVDFSGGTLGNGMASTPFKTLGAGLGKVSEGGTIKLLGGSSSETLTITQSVCLEAAVYAVRIGEATP